jgi:predicted dienelactone hydrolase
MRSFELLLLLACLLTFLLWTIPRLHAKGRIKWAVLSTLSIAIIQVLVEGGRWQMIPAYLLTGIFLLVWLLQQFVPAGGIIKRVITNRLVTVSALVLGIIVLGISFVLPIILPVFHFPRPGGPYGIGTATYDWADTNCREIFSTDTGARRELMVQVWYPARKGSSFPSATYIPTAEAVMAATSKIHHLPDFFLQHIKYVTTHSSELVPVTSDKPIYPVLIYTEGLTGYRQMTNFQVEELVSNGYIVVAIDQPGAAATVVFPEGNQITVPSVNAVMQPLIHQSYSPIEPAPLLNGHAMPNGIVPYFAADVSFVLDRLASLNAADPKGILTGRMDLTHTGLFGMSLGGTVGAEACLKDPRIKACLIEDVAMTADVVSKCLKQPTMFITRPAATMRLERQTAGGWAEADIVQTQNTMRAVYTSLPAEGYFVQIPGAYHIDFTDLDLLSPLLSTIGISGPIAAERAHGIINAYSVAFFDKVLKGATTALLDGPPTQYPEVIFETHRGFGRN